MGMRTADVSEPWSAPRRVVLAAVAHGRSSVGSRRGRHARRVGLSAADGLLGWDVRFAYLPAAESVLDGDSPYPALDDPILEEQKGYVYPPQLLFVLAPLDSASGAGRLGARGPADAGACRAHAVRPRGP